VGLRLNAFRRLFGGVKVTSQIVISRWSFNPEFKRRPK